MFLVYRFWNRVACVIIYECLVFDNTLLDKFINDCIINNTFIKVDCVIMLVHLNGVLWDGVMNNGLFWIVGLLGLYVTIYMLSIKMGNNISLLPKRTKQHTKTKVVYNTYKLF